MSDQFPSGYFFIRNVVSGKVLDVKDGNVNTPGNIVVVDKRIHGEVTQEWMLDIP